MGAHCAFSLALQGICDEIVLVDLIEQKVVSETQDLLDSVSQLPHRVSVRYGTYGSLAGCDIVVVSVGKIAPGDRLDELSASTAMVDSFIPRVVAAGFAGIFIVITNPCDLITCRVLRLSGFDQARVFGTGTALDTSRFRQVLARETGIDHKSITAVVLGEHGRSQVPVWSHVAFGGIPLSRMERIKSGPFGRLDRAAIHAEVRGAASVTYRGKGATEYGIASVLAKIVCSIFHDEGAIYPLSVHLDGQYGQSGLCISTLCSLGANGIGQIYELELSPEELAAYQSSCTVIKEHLKEMPPL